jgi:predicted DsbA family dithiol-disulfide isomerase
LAEPALNEVLKSNPSVNPIWRAFELRPEPFPTLNPRADNLRKIWEASVYPLAQELRVTIHFPPVQPRTRLAHQAAQWARSQGCFDKYHESLFRAFFERGDDIGDIDVLTSLATKLKLAGELLHVALVTGQFEQSVLRDERKASRLGVTEIPAFVANRKTMLSGVQPVENLTRLVESARF